MNRWGPFEWLMLLIVLAIVTAVIWISLAPFAHAADSTTLTGIPVDVLFTAIGTLCCILGGVVYRDIKRALRSLASEGHRRTRYIRHVESAVRQVCYKLNIPYTEDEDNGL